MAAALLRGPQLSVDTYDANLDFYLRFCFERDRLAGYLEGIAERQKQGDYSAAPLKSASLLRDILSNRPAWDRKIEEVNKALACLRTDDFFRPQALAQAMKDLTDLLDLVSLAHCPSSVRWGRFFAPSATDWDGAKAFAGDQAANLFTSLCREGLMPKIEQAGPDCMVFFISGPDQLLAGLTMARFARLHTPSLHLAFAGRLERLGGAAEYVDTLLPENPAQPLADLIARLEGKVSSRLPKDPDFSGLPLDDYLAPALVLPLERSSTDTGEIDTGLPPSLLLRQAARYGVRGFLCSDDLSLLAPGVPGGLDHAERPPFCLALSTQSTSPPSRDEMEPLYRAGVRLIRWHVSEKPDGSFTSTLWKAAKAGIWNQIELVPGLTGEALEGFWEFVMSNPNIAHAGLPGRPPDSPFGTAPGDGEDLPAPYAGVAPLPGRPLYADLLDPVHLLLYLNRHGAGKTSRWRTRDDGRSVYAVGDRMAFHFVPPHDLPPGYLDEICRMVEAGGSVKTRWVRYNLERAFLIAYVLEEGVIVANSSLKRPRQEYIDAVRGQTGLDLTQYLERGYTSVRPEYRGMGVGTKILEGLTARAGDRKLFAVIGEDNLATQKIALRNRTRKVAAFCSERSGKAIGIWIPEWMVEEP
jgi:GNAT superfamily N-acetyltransferase